MSSIAVSSLVLLSNSWISLKGWRLALCVEGLFFYIKGNIYCRGGSKVYYSVHWDLAEEF